MIPNEKLQEISNIKLKNVFELQEYLKSFKITDIADMAQELLDLREQEKMLDEGRMVTDSHLKLLDAYQVLQREKQLLIEDSERLAEYAKDVSDEAYIQDSPIYNLRIDRAREACDKHTALMKQAKGE
jgi:hypothetical protein